MIFQYAETCEIRVYLSRQKMSRWSFCFKIYLGNSSALFLLPPVRFYVETVDIYLGSLSKLTYNIPIAKTFKWSESSN